jgi:hypothetical protein
LERISSSWAVRSSLLLALVLVGLFIVTIMGRPRVDWGLDTESLGGASRLDGCSDLYAALKIEIHTVLERVV